MDKKIAVHTHNGILLSYKKKKNEILPSATTWMDLDGIMHSKTRKTEEDKYCMISLIYGV